MFFENHVLILRNEYLILDNELLTCIILEIHFLILKPIPYIKKYTFSHIRKSFHNIGDPIRNIKK